MAQSCGSIYNLIRGCNPAPGAWTLFNGRKLQLFDARKHQHGPSPRSAARWEPSPRSGTACSSRPTGGHIEVLKVRYDDGKKIPAAQFCSELGITLRYSLGRIDHYFEEQRMTTSYITHADCLRHEMGPGHPECPERLVAVNEHMRSSGLLDQLRSWMPRWRATEDLKRVHRPEYVDLIFENAPTEGYVQLDPDTVDESLHPGRGAPRGGRRGAGGGRAHGRPGRKCILRVRPCGHHATSGRSDGLLPVQQHRGRRGLRHRERRPERVAIVNFDVHHGNGTEDMFSPPRWQDRVLMVSFFQHPFYPGSGTEDPLPT